METLNGLHAAIRTAKASWFTMLLVHIFGKKKEGYDVWDDGTTIITLKTFRGKHYLVGSKEIKK